MDLCNYRSLETIGIQNGEHSTCVLIISDPPQRNFVKDKNLDIKYGFPSASGAQLQQDIHMK